MQSLADFLSLPLKHDDANSVARDKALNAVSWSPVPTSLVSYQAGASVLIIGESKACAVAASRLPQDVPPTILETAGAPSGAANAFHLRLQRITGYLGAFDVQVQTAGETTNLANLAGRSSGLFDQVLDLQDTKSITAQTPPPGYHAVSGERALSIALETIPELRGEFDKPRYFDYDASICAHARSGQQGCTRCLDACPADAITSLAEQIEVNAHLCQGGGTCTAVCPTGAIRYTHPSADDFLTAMRQLFRKYTDTGGTQAELLVFDSEHGIEQMRALAQELPGHVLPAQVEEIGSMGLEALVCAFAYGANRITLVSTATIADSVSQSLTGQIELCDALLVSMGYTTLQTRIVDAATLPQTDFSPLADALIPATFAAIGGKRDILRMAINELHTQSPAKPESAEMPAGSIFGQLHINPDACTLCMACVSVCPVSALATGAELPQLKFVEANCVQCGICANACPERAIELQPRYLFNNNELLTSRVLNQEQPFCCIVCAKPFATQSMMQRMEEKLSGHWMYQKNGSLNRLKMCEDCRVKDMFAKDGELSQTQPN
ncbi:MAG: 4Fe-4S binding protein [Arenicellales bacterium WSBS_2016_MAG_OTU3]